MQFQYRLVGRPTYPQKHILVCEDTLTHQIAILDHFGKIFEHQGIVQFSVVPGSYVVAQMIQAVKIDVIILDHDLPQGNGSDLLNWMAAKRASANTQEQEWGKIPVITFSGIPQNNTHMMSLGATHEFIKHDVINGAADEIIKTILGMKGDDR
jgi:CheY-like chemotaxis protein